MHPCAPLTAVVPRVVEGILGERTNAVGQSEYLIKWKQCSHHRDSWEDEITVVAHGGQRKLENYRRNGAHDEDDVDVEGFKSLERVIDHWHDEPSDTDYYLCKWMMVPYTDCTWEPAAGLAEYQSLIDDFVLRNESGGIPPCAKSLHRRVTFRKLTSLPAYLARCGVLRDYQLEAVNWLMYSWCQGNNVILADEMGLGKTIQSISFISALCHEFDFTGPVLVVVPLSTIAAWQKEFARWAPSLNTLLYVGDGRSRGIQRYYEWFAIPSEDGRRSSNDGPRPLFHVLLTTYELVLKDHEYLAQVDWRMLVVDEGHRLKNASSQLHAVLDSLSPTSRLLVTGTPLQNSIMELWSLLHFLMPAKFPDYEDFAQRYGPPEGAEASEEEAKNKLERLHRILKPHLLRRMKKDVETSLPGKVERILRVELTEEQKHLSRLIITKNYRELASQARNVGSLNNILVELKKVCNHPALLGGGNEQETSSLDRLVRASGKMNVLDQLLSRLHRDGHRVLIFSQMVRMLDILVDYLCRRGWAYQRLDGSTPSDARKRAIATFNAPDSRDFCFLLSTRAGGLGINLETADTVIIYDSDWNPQNDLQAMARAHRIGQTRSVNIYRLVSKNSVEETILERAKKKMILDHLVIQSMDTSTKLSRTSNDAPLMSGKKITREDLQAILKFGAEDLFKSASGTTPEKLDLDDILSRADSLEPSGPADSSTAGFFDQFKVADFDNVPEKRWEDIIPSDQVAAAQALIDEEEQRAKDLILQEALLTTASKRKARQSHKHPAAVPTLTATVGLGRSKARPASPRREREEHSGLDLDLNLNLDENIKLTKGVTRALLAALLRFGVLEERFATILKEVQEDQGECFKPMHLRHALGLIRRRVVEGEEEACKLSNLVHVNLSQLRERHRLVEFLYHRLSPFLANMAAFEITERGIKSVSSVGAHRWMIDWRTPQDDSKLLRGVFKHGFGRWVEIARDEELGLGKLLESLVDNKDDPKFLPKELHLGRRVENVLSHMMADSAGPHPGEEEALSKGSRDEAPPSKGLRDKTPPKSGRDKTPDPAAAQETSVGDRANCIEEPDERGRRGSTETTKELRRLLKPVRDDIAFLASLSAETFSSKLEQVFTALLSIGVLISNSRDGDGLWKYVASFWPTEITGRELKHFYIRICKERRSSKSN